MGFAKVFSIAVCGIKVHHVTVEVHVAPGLPHFSIVGLPDTEVKESRERVRSAIQNSGYEFPARRIVVNLAPADLPKESGRYDLPIAVGVLLAANIITSKVDCSDHIFAGELALDGHLRCTNGLLSSVLGYDNDSHIFILPLDNVLELNFLDGLKVLGATSLNDVVEYLQNKKKLIHNLVIKDEILSMASDLPIVDFANIKGQIVPKKALEIAAAGRHSMLMYGTPGCGKSLLARSIISILPKLTYAEALQVASIYSNSSVGFNRQLWRNIPFRSPHHTISTSAMVGGGSTPKPGEVSLSHNGILFLDELPEFSRQVIEVLREPLENKFVTISRNKYKVNFQADFQLITAMNPCPCGNYGNNLIYCSCTKEQRMRYNAKISAPIRDRIDLVVPVQMVKPSELILETQCESSAIVAERVLRAREIQLSRQGKLNYMLSNAELELYCEMSKKVKEHAINIVDRQNLSVRSYHRMLKLALTIRDLAGILEAPLSMQDISLASFYRTNYIS